jgi:ABC-type phosphate transport system substrate-binding protein
MALRTLVVLSVLVHAVSVAPGAHAAASYKIIVNAANPVTVLSRADASGYFLKRKTKWPSGVTVAPVDLSSTSAIRAAFCREVLGKPPDEVMHYWQVKIFSGSDTPPPVKASDEDVVAFVKGNAGAIGYVAATTVLSSEVRIVTMGDASQP